jgi:transcriptional regulator with XRE-family HTH domain
MRGRAAPTLEETMAVTYRTREQVAERIRELREERDMTQRALAEALGMDPASMNRIEKGERGVSTGELVAMADALGVEADAILRLEEPAFALRANCADEDVRESLAAFREVIADYFAAEALAR